MIEVEIRILLYNNFLRGKNVMDYMLLVFVFLLSSCGFIAKTETAKKIDARPQERMCLDSESSVCGKNKQFDNDRDALAYAYGLDRGLGLLRRYQYLREIGVEMDVSFTQKGFLDAMAVANDNTIDPSLLTIEETKGLIYSFDREVARIEQNLAQLESLLNRDKGFIYLSKNSNKKDVLVFDSGLQYRIIKTGDGKKVQFNDEVLVHYQGKTIDGAVFDSSYDGDPKTFRVTSVIAGWQEALQSMHVGDQWEIVVPPHLGYGESRHGDIPANSVLVFELHLLDAKKE